MSPFAKDIVFYIRYFFVYFDFHESNNFGCYLFVCGFHFLCGENHHKNGGNQEESEVEPWPEQQTRERES